MLTYLFLPIIQGECDTFCCSHTDSFKHDLCCVYYQLSQIYKSSHRRCSTQKAVLKSFAIFTGKHLCWSPFLIKLPALSRATLLKRDSNTAIFLWILRIFKSTYFEEHVGTATSKFSVTASISNESKLCFT